MKMKNGNVCAAKVATALLIPLILFAFSGCAEFGFFGASTRNFDTVIIDPGHGGHDSGAHAVFGPPEKILTLDVALRLADILRNNGYGVILTRHDDYFISLGHRVALANSTRNCIFVSIHFNWSKSGRAHGVETYYYYSRWRSLAANIQREVLHVYGGTNRGIKYNSYYVLHHNRRPAVLCELAFISNPYDNSIAQNPSYHQRLAEAIAAGIIAERNGRNP